jgi:oligopeptidase B
MVGAVLNQAPELFAAAVAQVAFVDVLNTMLDPDLPLTVTEWEEWGNPAASEDIYRVMRSYSPYENVVSAPYPSVLATGGLHDTRVGFWEPAKWVQVLRAATTGDGPVLLWTDLGAGHGGPSGRYDAWREEARILAYILWALRRTE